MHEQEVRVLGGLPLTATYEWCRAEPDVGIDSAYAEDVRLVDRNGRPALWAEDRMNEEAWSDLEIQIAISHHSHGVWQVSKSRWTRSYKSTVSAEAGSIEKDLQEEKE